MSNVYGKELLDLIKAEELEEKNRQLREEAERKRQLLELEKRQKMQHASISSTSSSGKQAMSRDESAKMSNKIGVKKTVPPPLVPHTVLDPASQRPAFLTITEPFQSYRKFILTRKCASDMFNIRSFKM
jgi:hypothetical protein